MQLIGFDTSSTVFGDVYVYACTGIEGYGIPLLGDRSAYDAENFPLRHTNDTDIATTAIHHTLGTGANQAAAGNHLHFLNKLNATATPIANDDSGDGYTVGSVWIDVTNDKAYICVDVTLGAAVWNELGGGGGFTNPMTAQGDMITGGASGAAGRLAIGTPGQVLQVNSGATDPEWVDPPVSNLDGLTDVVITTPATGQVLKFDGTN